MNETKALNVTANFSQITLLTSTALKKRSSSVWSALFGSFRICWLQIYDKHKGRDRENRVHIFFPNSYQNNSL